MKRENVGVILAAGEGHRMGAISAHYAKPVLPICNSPLISSHLGLLAGIGIKRIIVVVGYMKDKVTRTALDCCPNGVELTFLEQPQRLGIAHALYLTQPATSDANIVVVLGDTHFSARNLSVGLNKLEGNGSGKASAVLSVRKVRDPEMIRRECTVRFDFHGRLLEIREKPQTPFNDLKPCGIYFFTPDIHEAIEYTSPSPLRGEVELTDSIQSLIDMGRTVTSAPTVEWDRNINYPGDILMSNLVELRRRNLTSCVADDVTLHHEAVVSDSVVGRQCRISSPARLERTLVLDGAEVTQHGTYKDCIIGPGFIIADCLKEEWADTPQEQ